MLLLAHADFVEAVPLFCVRSKYSRADDHSNGGGGGVTALRPWEKAGNWPPVRERRLGLGGGLSRCREEIGGVIMYLVLLLASRRSG